MKKFSTKKIIYILKKGLSKIHIKHLLENKIFTISVSIIVIILLLRIIFTMYNNNDNTKYAKFIDSIQSTDMLDTRDPIVILETKSKNNITKLYAIELYQRYTPVTVGNFLNLVRDNFYINKKFDKNDSSEILKCNKYCEDNAKDNRLQLEISPRLTHKASGTLGMMRDIKKHYSSNTKFYITTGTSNKNYLNGNYVIFGQVIYPKTDLTEIENIYNFKIIDYNHDTNKSNQ